MKIYSAVYSGTNVYEMEVNGIAVMRRRHDSWLNATQILKVAGVDKGKRTKILEKEIQTGEHEKIQGGYGKYQGTWICFDRGVEVCRQYGVEEVLRPLLTYDMGQDGGIAGQGNFNTPTKEQAMAAQRKRLYNASNENRANGASGTFFRGISNTASNMVGIISKARFDSPGPRSRPGAGPAERNGGLARAPSFTRQQSIQSEELPNSQQSFVSDYGRDNESAGYLSQPQSTQQSMINGTEPPRKRARMDPAAPDNNNNSFMYSGDVYASVHANTNASAFPGSPTEPNDSFVYSQAGLNNVPLPPNDGHTPLAPLPFEVSPEADNKRNTLMSLFMDTTGNDQPRHDILRRMTPYELDMPIDAQSHTALHWAATLSRMPLLRALIASGANPFRVNAVGETALMRACLVTNSHEHSSMPDLLDVLGSTIEVRDAKGRTVLHHIAVTSSVKGRSAASRYYLQCLLEWVVRQGSAPSSQVAGVNGNGAAAAPTAKLGLARFMSEIVNAQDKAGDTALNIAAKIGNRSIISQLLEVCADPNLPNRQGLRPLDFGVGTEAAGDAAGGEMVVDGEHGVNSSQKSRESSDEIVTSITHLLTEAASVFQGEMKTRQQAVDTLHSSLRTTSAQLGEARRTLEALQEKAKSQQQARQRVLNLTRARDEEQFRVQQLEQANSQAAQAAVSWDEELEAAGATATATTGTDASSPKTLPSAAVLQARIQAMRTRTAETRQAEQALKSRSRDMELKFRHLVALATRCSDTDVDSHLDGLMRAVESEKGDLEIGRVRRFLGGVEGVVH